MFGSKLQNQWQVLKIAVNKNQCKRGVLVGIWFLHNDKVTWLRKYNEPCYGIQSLCYMYICLLVTSETHNGFI